MESPIAAWTPRAAERMARERGIAVLTPLHWRVVTLCREDAARTGVPPDLERLASLVGTSGANLEQLFGDHAAATVGQIAGLAAGR